MSYYLAARKALLELHEAVDGFAATLHGLTLAHVESWWPDLTYWQPAQVSSFGDYLLSFGHEAARHLDRIRQAWSRCGLVPVAAGGVAGTTVPLSRTSTLRRLGLTGPATTSRDAMWSVDGLLDVVFAAQQATLTASRLAEDYLLFATEPFGYLRLHDSYCRASVYLPQKRNPYALSVVRGSCAVVTGRAAGVVAAVGTGSAQTDNWIYNYGETLEAVELASQMSALITEVAGRASFDTARMADRAPDGFTEPPVWRRPAVAGRPTRRRPRRRGPALAGAGPQSGRGRGAQTGLRVCPPAARPPGPAADLAAGRSARGGRGHRAARGTGADSQRSGRRLADRVTSHHTDNGGSAHERAQDA